MKTQEEAIQKAKHLYALFMDVRKQFPDVTLNKSGEDNNYQVYFVGNKTAGTDYELNMWKTVPILHCCVVKYSNVNEYFLDMRLNYRGHKSSEDWLMSDADFKKQVKIAFESAIKEFMVCNV